MDALTEKIVGFIRSLGIEVTFGKLSKPTVLPGMDIHAGAITIDTALLKYAGDLLHEAGHIAVIPRSERCTLNGEVIGRRPHSAAEEMMAMAWSYAACHHLNINPEEVFHAGGYRGGGDNLIESMKSACPVGIPMLQYHGMSFYGTRAAEEGIEPFPAMHNWTMK